MEIDYILNIDMRQQSCFCWKNVDLVVSKFQNLKQVPHAYLRDNNQFVGVAEIKGGDALRKTPHDITRC